jgi:hypothetical protein
MTKRGCSKETVDYPLGAKDGDRDTDGFSDNVRGALVGFGVVGKEGDSAGDGKGVGPGFGALLGKLVVGPTAGALVGLGVVGGELDGLDDEVVVTPGAVGGWKVEASVASTTPVGAAVMICLFEGVFHLQEMSA